MLYNLLVLGGLLLALGMVLANLRCFDGLDPAPPPGEDAPSVSVLIPARNEALNIKACVTSLLAQDYPNYEVLVLDDESEDETSALVEELAATEEGARLSLLIGATLPGGWVGKNWACHQLAGRAQGDFLFFTDADTEHAPGTISAAVAYAQRKEADLVSAWPGLITRTWSEKLIIPMIVVFGMALYPHWLLMWLQGRPAQAGRWPASLRRMLGAANGQFLFFTRAGYERIGGHSAVRDHLVEDVALGRAVTEQMPDGLRLFNCDALAFSTCRMYRRFGEVWEGFTKNLRPAFERSVAGFIAVGVLQTCGFLLPFFFIFLFPQPPVGGLIALQIGIIYLIRIILTQRFCTSWLSCWLHPFGELFGLIIGLNSWRRTARQGVTWKGRSYQVEQ